MTDSDERGVFNELCVIASIYGQKDPFTLI